MDDIITSQSEFFQNIMTKIDAASNVASELLNNQRKRLCQEHQKEMPTQIKLVYDVISDRINADYSYDIIFSDDQNKTAYDVLDEWYQLEKSNEK